MKNFLVSYFPQIATYTTIIVIFTQNVLFDKEGACTCQDQKLHCNLYIIMPIFIILLLVLWKDKNFNGTCRACCCMETKRMSGTKCCHVIFVQMVKASVISLLWVVSVLFDGDWYACCENHLAEEKAPIPCKKNRTLEEQVIIDDLKNESKIIGLGVLLGLLLLVFCYSLLKWSSCCRKCSGYIDGDELYELIIIKEEENIVNEILKERAKEALTKKVDEILNRNERNVSMDCYKPAQKVIDQLWQEGNQENIEGPSKDKQGEGPSTSGDQSSTPLIDPENIEGPSKDKQGEGPSTSGDQSRTSSIDLEARF